MRYYRFDGYLIAKMQGITMEPGFQVNDFREFFMMYGLEHHFTYEKCQEMIGTFLGQMSSDILMEQHH